MSAPYGSHTQWNIFARELEEILKQHGLTITRLDDLKIVTHPMKIKRLKASLAAPTNLTTLNPGEMELLQTKLDLNQTEVVTLRAALLATAVERTLMDRIEPQLALMAANDVYRLLLQAMIRNPNSRMATAPKEGMAVSGEHEILGDIIFEEALDLIDRASLSLHLSQEATTPQAKVTHAREAHDAYTHALDCLRRSRLPAHSDDDWMQCEAECLQGQENALTLVRQGGGDL